MEGRSKCNLYRIICNKKVFPHISQLDLACAFVSFVLDSEDFIDCDEMNYSDRVYLTGHSKGGWLVQQIILLHELLYNIKLRGVTFAAIPIAGLNKMIRSWKNQKLINQSFNLKQCTNINYLLKSDKALLGFRLKQLYYLYKNSLQKTSGLIMKLKVHQFIKVLYNRRPGYVGKSIVLRPSIKLSNRYQMKRLLIKHGLFLFDNFFSNGKIITKRRHWKKS